MLICKFADILLGHTRTSCLFTGKKWIWTENDANDCELSFSLSHVGESFADNVQISCSTFSLVFEFFEIFNIFYVDFSLPSPIRFICNDNITCAHSSNVCVSVCEWWNLFCIKRQQRDVEISGELFALVVFRQYSFAVFCRNHWRMMKQIFTYVAYYFHYKIFCSVFLYIVLFGTR